MSTFFWLFILGIVCGYLGILIAERKGRRSMEGFLLGFFFDIIGLIVEFILPAEEMRTTLRGGTLLQLDRHNRQLRKCPYCAEMVLAQAKVCKHCGKDLPEYREETTFRQFTPKIIYGRSRLHSL